MKRRLRRRRKQNNIIVISICLTAVILIIAILASYLIFRQTIKVDGDIELRETQESDEEQGSLNFEKSSKENNAVPSSEKPERRDSILVGMSDDGVQTNESEILPTEDMTIEDKVAQLFVVTPESLTNIDGVTSAGELTRAAINKIPVGGLVYFSGNIVSEEQCSEMVSNVQQFSIDRIGLPMLTCIDEEGGTVARISGRGIANVPDIPSMYYIGEKGDPYAAYSVGDQIGSYLSRFGINVDFAPIADIFSNESNTVIGERAFGNTPDLVAQMVCNMIVGLKRHNVCCTLKHFPGHGDTMADSHYGEVYSYKSLEDLRKFEFVPFEAGIKAGADLVMVGHISLPNVIEDNTPSSLSYTMITEILRNELGFDGVVITDALNMRAISDNYSSGDAAVRAIEAGADMILMPEDFSSAYTSVLDAVRKGIISSDRINQSIDRIIRLKKLLF